MFGRVLEAVPILNIDFFPSLRSSPISGLRWLVEQRILKVLKDFIPLLHSMLVVLDFESKMSVLFKVLNGLAGILIDIRGQVAYRDLLQNVVVLLEILVDPSLQKLVL